VDNVSFHTSPIHTAKYLEEFPPTFFYLLPRPGKETTTNERVVVLESAERNEVLRVQNTKLQT
jgi:hypothetical protein